MKLRFLLPIAVLALVFVACEIDDDECDAENPCPEGQICQITAGEEVGTCVDDTPSGCTTDDDCPGEQTCNASGQCEGGGPTGCTSDADCDFPEICSAAGECDPGQKYFYVRIDDLSPESDTEDGGADIDAITIFKLDGGTAYATDIIAFEHGGGMGDALDPTEATGEPDAFMDYPDTTVCEVSDNAFLSLGGQGGYMIAQMGDEMAPGDTLEVLEVGGCEFGGANPAIPEDVQVMISVASDPDSSYWELLGEGTGPEVVFVLPDSLPRIPVE